MITKVRAVSYILIAVAVAKALVFTFKDFIDAPDKRPTNVDWVEAPPMPAKPRASKKSAQTLANEAKWRKNDRKKKKEAKEAAQKEEKTTKTDTKPKKNDKKEKDNDKITRQSLLKAKK